MASTIGITGPFGHVEDGVLKGARRARFSLHMKTHKARRWLLVQLVSVPVEQSQEDQPEAAYIAQAQTQKPRGLDRLVDDYRMSQALRSWA